VIKLAAVENHRLLIDGLRAWAETVPDIEIAVVAATVDAFLLDSPGPYDVVLLNPWLRADPDAAANVRRTKRTCNGPERRPWPGRYSNRCLCGLDKRPPSPAQIPLAWRRTRWLPVR